MTTPQKLTSVAQFNKVRGQDTAHPLITLLDQSKSTPFPPTKYLSELYIIFIKDVKCADLVYGRNHYDYEDGTMVFIAPNQVLGVEDETDLIYPNGWVLAFHPDLIRGTSLGKTIEEYHYFSYEVNEALHLSIKERQIILDCFQKIQYELELSIDKYSRKLIVSNLELLLNYCTRFYNRQFISREIISTDVLTRFENLLDNYFLGNEPKMVGLLTVSYCAEKLNLSPNYFGDLIKKESGKTPQEYIRLKLISVSKEKLFDESLSISEISYQLGFKYPQHFTRLFKKEVGVSPVEFRNSN